MGAAVFLSTQKVLVRMRVEPGAKPMLALINARTDPGPHVYLDPAEARELAAALIRAANAAPSDDGEDDSADDFHRAMEKDD